MVTISGISPLPLTGNPPLLIFVPKLDALATALNLAAVSRLGDRTLLNPISFSLCSVLHKLASEVAYPFSRNVSFSASSKHFVSFDCNTIAPSLMMIDHITQAETDRRRPGIERGCLVTPFLYFWRTNVKGIG